MPSFAEIEREIRNILSIPDEELTDEQRQAFEEYAEMLAGQEEDKVDGFVAFIRSEDARADFLREEAKRLTNAARCIESKLARLKTHYQYTMQSHGLKRVNGKAYSVSLRATPVVLVENEQQVPTIFWRTKTETSIDKTAVRDALKSGAVVPGCSLGKSYSLHTA
jgi:hypothetical protein